MTLGQLIRREWMDYSLLACLRMLFFFFMDERNICSTLAHDWLRSGATHSRCGGHYIIENMVSKRQQQCSKSDKPKKQEHNNILH